MRIIYRGTEYVLAHTGVSASQISAMTHIGNIQIPSGITTQIYLGTNKNDEPILYSTAVMGNSQVINWIKRLVPVSQVEDLIGYAL